MRLLAEADRQDALVNLMTSSGAHFSCSEWQMVSGPFCPQQQLIPAV